MQNVFIKKERIEKTYEKINLDDNSLDDKFFKGCREATIDSEMYKTMSDKNEYDRLGDMIEENYLKHGLDADEAQDRLNLYGRNKLPEKVKVPEIVKFLKEISNTFALLMWAACALSFLGYGLSPYDMSNVFLKIKINKFKLKIFKNIKNPLALPRFSPRHYYSSNRNLQLFTKQKIRRNNG